jgi:hypothetical protein
MVFHNGNNPRIARHKKTSVSSQISGSIMKIINNLKKLIILYRDSVWLPATLAICLLTCLMAIRLCNVEPPLLFDQPLKIIVVLAFGGLLVTGVRNLYLKRWLRGLVNLFISLLFFLTVALIYVSLWIFFEANSGKDDFAEKLSIPKNIEVTVPLKESFTIPGDKPSDPFHIQMSQALQTPGVNNAVVTAKLDSLIRLQKTAPTILQRYLVSSPDWYVFKERGKLYATRRLTLGSPEPIGFTLGFSGQPRINVTDDCTRLSLGKTAPLKLHLDKVDEYRFWESYCIIKTNGVNATIRERTKVKERRLTKAVLRYLEAELSPLAAKPDWATIQALLPPNGIRRGKPSIMLRNSIQPGIYESEIRVNPGEPGMVYLKAYEVTTGTPLSVDRLPENSNELVGWSDDPNQLFLSNTNFTIYEGDWGQPYAARFEVWFVPDSGQKERQLLERVFKIEGWQR